MNVTNDNQHQDRVFNEFSPKILILQTKSVLLYLLSRWGTILLFATLTGLAAAAYYYFKKPNYTAEITFALDEGVAQNHSANVEVDRDFGIGREMGLSSYDAGTIFSSMTNIVELMQSRLLIEKTLRKTIKIDQHTVTFADFFLDSLDYRKKWLKKSSVARPDFSAAHKEKQEALRENSIIGNIYSTLIAKNLKIDRKGKGTTIISVTCISTNESFSKYFLEALLNEVTQYYIETKTQRSKNIIDMIQRRTDSIRLAFNKALYGKASFTDAHINPGRHIVSVSSEKQQTDVQILRTSYIELVRSLEIAKTNLMRDTPLIQYLDTPILPLLMSKASLPKKFILFFLVGAVFLSACLLVFKTINYILHH
jgi:uncharacterized protein involved in exopolysaccharide biosynthesis